MQFTTSSLAAMLVIGFASAQTQTCSNVPNPSPPGTMHCNARGIFIEGLGTGANITNVTPNVANIDSCITVAKTFPAAYAFSYNYTSGDCVEYGQTLTSMGWRPKRKFDPDTVYYNHNCYVLQCNNAVISTMTDGSGSTTVVTSAAPATTTAPTCDANADDCLAMFQRRSKVATSVCSGISTQYFPPPGFGNKCTGVYDNQVSSVCSCLFGPQLIPQTTFTSNMSTTATITANMTQSTFTAGPTTASFTNSTTSATFPTMTQMPTTTNNTISSVIGSPITANSTTTSASSTVTEPVAPFPIGNSTISAGPTGTGGPVLADPVTTSSSSMTQNATIVLPIGFNTTSTTALTIATADPIFTNTMSNSSIAAGPTAVAPVNTTTSATPSIPMGTGVTVTAPITTGPSGTGMVGTGTISGFPAPTANSTTSALMKRFRYRLRN